MTNVTVGSGGWGKSKVSTIKLKSSGIASVVPPLSIYHVCIEKEVDARLSRRSPVAPIICIPLPIGVLDKRGTLEDKMSL